MWNRLPSLGEAQVEAPPHPSTVSISLRPEARRCLGNLARRFTDRRNQLLEARSRRRQKPAVPRASTTWVRAATWRCAPPTAETKPMRRAMHAAARAHRPLATDLGSDDRLDGVTRPRSLDAVVPQVTVDGHAICASLHDLGLFLYRHAHAPEGTATPCVVLPAMESFEEALWFHDVIGEAEHWLQLRHGSVTMVVTVASARAIAEIQEILFAVRSRAMAVHTEVEDPRSLAELRNVCVRRGVAGLGGLDSREEAA